jgi:hypothetical protein
LAAQFTLPTAEDRTVIMGQTGTGKSVLGGWVLSRQNFEKRPWVALDFKNEILWDKVGDPPMRPLRLGEMPGKTGFYRMHVRPDQDEELERWLWDIWHRATRHKSCGLFVDEVSLIPKKAAFKAILRQGRSLHLPVIACTQRPVDCDREVFSEAQYRVCMGLEDARDYKTVQGLFGDRDIRDNVRTLKPHHSLWYDAKQKTLFNLKPCPPPATVASELKANVPYSWFAGA